MEQKWIKTEEMLENLHNEPGVEQQYARYLGPILRSTHWLKYDAEQDLYGDSTGGGTVSIDQTKIPIHMHARTDGKLFVSSP